MSGRLEDAVHGAPEDGDRAASNPGGSTGRAKGSASVSGPSLPWALAAAILAISTSSLFVRFALEDAPALVVAAARLGFATIFVAPFALLRHHKALATLTRRDLILALAAGTFLALHFATWIASLEFTSVVSSVVLVTTSPLWVALLSPWLLRERLTARVGAGILLALAGSAVIGAADLGSSAGSHSTAAHPNPIGGDLLALAGAWAMAGYLMIGRKLRARFDLVPYVFLVYGMGALVLLGMVIGLGIGVPEMRPVTWGWLMLLALVPQVIGHSTFNWALKTLPAAIVSVALLGEPIASAVLAYLFLGERPLPLTLLGAAVILCGLTVAATAPRRDGA